jgi:flavin reductase (DIM6/NTAB) family NADH-FMN oxidoreductase RutF/DNA-binding MarR family transcriptional regulator
MSNTDSNAAFDVRDFRRALGQFPTGVTIITTKDQNGEPIGVTASSFNSVSVSPALVLWSVDKGAFSASIMENAEHFAVNVLSKSQVDMSNRFAGRGEDKFAGIDYSESPHGSPLFKDCSAQFECKTWNVYEGGDHLIIVGEILDYRHDESQAPLVFACGSYAVSMQHPASVASDTVKVPGDGLLGDYMLYLLRVAYTKCSTKLYPELMEKHGIAPEEWRALTLLADTGEAESSDLAKMIGQPVDVFRATAERMQSKGYITVLSEGQVKLTEEGRVMTNRLFEIAQSQEKVLLEGLNDQQIRELKDGLKNVAQIDSAKGSH